MFKKIVVDSGTSMVCSASPFLRHARIPGGGFKKSFIVDIITKLSLYCIVSVVRFSQRHMLHGIMSIIVPIISIILDILIGIAFSN